jgi:hypothetical protein
MITTQLRRLAPVVALLAAALAGARANAITISAAKALGNGQSVTLDDVVISNTIDLVNSGSSANFMVQDATGGITVFGTNADIAAALTGVAAGDRVDIAGLTLSFNGLFELGAPLSTTLDTAGVGVPAPAATTLAELQSLSAAAETKESVLVRISNVTFSGLSPGQLFAGNTNYTVTDGTVSTTVRVPTNMSSLIGDPIPTGPVFVTGIVSQFDATNPAPGVPGAGYQVLLLDDSSLVPVPEPASVGLFAMLCAATGVARRRRA